VISRALSATVVVFVSLLMVSTAAAAPAPIEPVQLQRGEAVYSPVVGVAPDGSGEIAFGERLSPSTPDRHAAVARGADGSYGPLQQLTRTHNSESPPILLFGEGDSLFAAWGIATTGAHAEWARRSPSGLFGATEELGTCGRFLSYAALPNGSIAVACSAESGTAPNDDVVFFGELAPGAEFFTANIGLSGSGIDDNFIQPQTAVGADGTLVVGWSQKDATSSQDKVQIRVRPAGSASFEPIKTLVEATAPDEDELDDVAVLPDGTVLALVAREPGLELYTRPPGVASVWSGPQPLFSDYAGGTISVNPTTGGATMVVTHGPPLLGEPLQIAVASRPPGGEFGPFTTIASGHVFARGLETAPDGTTFLTWGDYSGPSNSVLGSFAPPGGGFGPPVTIASDVNSFATALDPAGNVLAAWTERVGPNDERLLAGGIDSGAPPSFGSVDVPATVLAGAPATLSASATDWSGLREVRWELPGGTVLNGATVSHDFATPGTATVKVTAVDRAGNATTASREIRVVDATAQGKPQDRTKPKLTLKKLRKKLKLKDFLRGVSTQLVVNEPSRVEVELLANARSAHVSSASKSNLILASMQLKNVSGKRIVRLRPNRRLLGGAKHFRVTLRVSAVDAAGNETVAQRPIRVG
jgi:PKD domain-containing protein